MKTGKNLLLLSLLALILILSACGKSNNTENKKETENMGNMNMEDSSKTGSNSSTNSSSGDEVSVTASNWKWELSKTDFKVGETVTFSIQGKEGVHGFSINGTNINEQIAPGETKKVTWIPDKAGEYTIACSIACGTGHSNMVQKITVN